MKTITSFILWTVTYPPDKVIPVRSFNNMGQVQAHAYAGCNLRHLPSGKNSQTVLNPICVERAL